jgi:UDP-glucose 4-epimerase
MSRVLISGGCGNLGRLCASDFAAAGHDVVLLDRLGPSAAPIPWSSDLPVYVASLTDGSAVEKLMFEVSPEIIVHLAAEPQPSDHPDPRRSCLPNFDEEDGRMKMGATQEAVSSRQRDATIRSNVLGTYYLLDCATRAGVRRIVAASSLCVLGMAFRISARPMELEYLPIDERHPLRPEDSYSLSKLLNEQMYAAYARAYGLEAVAIRPPVVVYQHVEASWRGRFRDEPDPLLDGVEANLWMYVDGRDLSAAFVQAAQATDIVGFEAFYVATGRTITTSPKRWLRENRPDLDHLTEGLGDDDDLLSIDKAKRLLGYQPTHAWLT